MPTRRKPDPSLGPKLGLKLVDSELSCAADPSKLDVWGLPSAGRCVDDSLDDTDSLLSTPVPSPVPRPVPVSKLPVEEICIRPLEAA